VRPQKQIEFADSEEALSKSERDLLRRIFSIAGKQAGGSQEHVELVQILENRIAKLRSPVAILEATKPSNWACAAFGVKSPRELAEHFVSRFEQMKFRSKTLGEFLSAARIEGHRNRVRGELFHLFVRNFEPLQADFRRDALLQLEELNNPQLAPSVQSGGIVPNWMNAKGMEIPRLQQFGRPRRAQNVRITKKNGKTVEFVDDMYVAYSDGALGRLWTFLNEVEVKTSSAARRFAKQIGFAQLRLGATELKRIEMSVEGFKKRVTVPPERIIFSQRSISRNAITLYSNRSWARLDSDIQAALMKAMETGDVAEIYKRSDFRIQDTTQQAEDSVFLRITLAVHADYLNAFVQAIWPNLCPNQLRRNSGGNEALERGLKEKSAEFVEKGSEVHAKT
jgi:hypothetical protein